MLYSLSLNGVGYGMNFFTSSRRLGRPDLPLNVKGELGNQLYTYVFSQ